jgi:transposase
MARRVDHNGDKERYWRQLLAQWQGSGQTVRWFCLAHGLSEPSFYAWRRTINQRDQQAQRRRQRGRRQVEPAAATDACGREGDLVPTFVPVTVAAPESALELVLRDGHVVRVPPGFDAVTLRQLVAALDREAPPC